MKEIIEIYTKSKTFKNIGEIMREVTRIRTQIDATAFTEIARYICEGPNGKNILVELQVSTKWGRDNGLDDHIDIAVYEFEGELENYSANVELETIHFNRIWKTAIKQMKRLAMKYLLCEYNEMLRNTHGECITVQLRTVVNNDGDAYYYYTSANYGNSDNYDSPEEAYKAADDYLRGAGELW